MEGIWLTTWDVQNPLNNGIFTISTGAGFLPSTVSFPFCGWLLDRSYVSLVQRLVITACLIDGHIIDKFQRPNIQQHQLSTVDKPAFQVSHEKTTLIFHYTGCLIGILIMVLVVFHPLCTLNNQGFFIAQVQSIPTN